jgi:hypothetical protein
MPRRIRGHWLLLALCALSAPAPAADPPRRLLLIGNSITYTNNLPALLYELLKTQGRAAGVTIDMFVRGGATVRDLGRDPRLGAALNSGRYDAVVIQEQGGNTLCAGSPAQRAADPCRQMIAAHLELARRARSAGAIVYYLGTYQDAVASQALVASESWLAGQMDARYIEMSQTLLALRTRNPDLAWFHERDRHPGIMLSVVMADRIYLSLYGAYPSPAPLCTPARLYSPGEKLDGLVRFPGLNAARGPMRCVATAEEARLITLALAQQP